jgi:hypothetical protein
MVPFLISIFSFPVSSYTNTSPSFSLETTRRIIFDLYRRSLTLPLSAYSFD